MEGRALHTTPSPALPHTSSPGCTWLLASPAPPSYTHDSTWPANDSLSGNYTTQRSLRSARFQVDSAELLQRHLHACSFLLSRPIKMVCAGAQLPCGSHTAWMGPCLFISVSTAWSIDGTRYITATGCPDIKCLLFTCTWHIIFLNPCNNPPYGVGIAIPLLLIRN